MSDKRKNKDQLIREIGELRKKVSRLEKEEAECKESGGAKEKLIHDLEERYKELNLLYEVAKLSTGKDLSMEEILRHTVKLIPPSWHYPDITCARIVHGDREFKTKNYKHTSWVQSSEIYVENEKAGKVEVCYLEEKPELEEGPFLKEERDLLNTLSSLLSSIIERKQTEDALRESEHKFRDIFETAREGIAYTTLGGTVVDVNSHLGKILGIPTEDIVDKHILSLTKNFLDAKNAKKIIPLLKKLLQGKDIPPFEAKYRDRILEVSSAYNPKTKRMIGIISDITERKKAEERLKESLREKEVLITEIHHRVKNNMQVIASLINIQSRRIDDEKIREIFKDTRNRVLSMALVHERLYRTGDLAKVDFGQYIQTMSTHLMNLHKDPDKKIKIDIDTDDIPIDINKAVPLGLIVNEIITNSLRHAFPEKKKGKISVNFHKKNKTYYLRLHDNGIGIPDSVDFQNPESMGFDLVNSLVDQIDGKIRLGRKDGTLVEITFSD